MNKTPPLLLGRFLFLVLTAALLLTACQQEEASTPLPENLVKAGVAATLTKQAFASSVDAVRLTETAANLPTSTPNFTETPTAAPTFTHSPEPAHYIIPGAPSVRNTFVTDLITVDLAKEKTAVGDNYSWSRMERPYTPETMEYRGDLDIMRVDFQVAEPWVYLTFILVEDLPLEGESRYAVELDNDHDGRGDLLVTVPVPASAEWTTDGVQVFADEDEDIGGLFPLYEDTSDPDQNGYETRVFPEGTSEDPDLAWVRRDPEEDSQLQMAFKKELIGQSGLLWSAWTNGGLMDPSLYDFNDHYTFEEAGSPNKGNYRYPVKAVALVDSTCRSWYGYIPAGTEPGLCYTNQQPQKDQPGLGYCVATYSPQGCQSSCLVECPEGELCVPCRRK